MASCRCGKDAILPYEEFLDAVRCTDFGDDLGDFGVPVAAIAAYD